MAVHRLDPWPVNWCQLNDPARDGDNVGPNGSGNNAYNDCGPESVAEVVKYITGVALDADYIKDVACGPNFVGYTNWGNLELFLNDYAEIQTGQPLVADPATVAGHIKAWINAGHPAIALFYGGAIETPNMDGPQTGGHFCCVFGYDDAGNMIISDPWTGTERTMTPAQWNWCSQGQALACNRSRSIAA